MITQSDFEQVELRAGTVVDAQIFPEAKKPAIKVWVDFGPEIGIKKSSAQIAHHYTPDSLIWTQIVGVVNFPPKQIGNFISEFLVTGFADSDGQIVLTRPELVVANGSKLF